MINRTTIQNALEAIPFFILAYSVRLLPRTLALNFGRYLGRFSRFLQPARSRTAYENLKRAYPEYPESWHKGTRNKVFEHLGISAVEMLRLDSFNSKADLERYFQFEGLEHLDSLRATPTGAFFFSGHIGFWETGTFFLGQLGFSADFVAKTIRNPFIDQFFLRQREAGGGHCLDSKNGARRILRALAQKRQVCVLLDQHISKKQAVIVNFFNRPAYATPIIPQIALKTGVPIFPMFTYRNPDFTYRVIIHPPLQLEGPETAENIQRHTQTLSNILEKAVREQPDQWFWVHRRWRKSAEIRQIIVPPTTTSPPAETSNSSGEDQ